jgi:hypothetical protein
MLKELNLHSISYNLLLTVLCQIQKAVIVIILQLVSLNVMKVLILLLTISQISSPHNVHLIMDAKLFVTLILNFARQMEIKPKEMLLLLTKAFSNSTHKCFQHFNKLMLKIKKFLKELVHHSLMKLNTLLKMISDVRKIVWRIALTIIIIIQINSLVALFKHAAINTSRLDILKETVLCQLEILNLFSATSTKMVWSYAQDKKIAPLFLIKLNQTIKVQMVTKPLPCNLIHTQSL